MARLKKPQTTQASSSYNHPNQGTTSAVAKTQGRSKHTTSIVQNETAPDENQSEKKKKRKRKRKARTEVSSSSESDSDSDDVKPTEKSRQKPKPEQPTTVTETSDGEERPKDKSSKKEKKKDKKEKKDKTAKKEKKDKKKRKEQADETPAEAEATAQTEEHAEMMDVDDDEHRSESGKKNGEPKIAEEPSNAQHTSSHSSDSDSSDSSDGEDEETQNGISSNKKGFQKSSEIPPSLRLMRDPEMDTCAKFESYYMSQLTKEFADDLDKVRQAKDFGGNSLPMLVRALKSGTSTFNNAEMRAAIEAGGSRTEE